MCETSRSGGEKSGQASVRVRGGDVGVSAQIFSFQVSAPLARLSHLLTLRNLFQICLFDLLNSKFQLMPRCGLGLHLSLRFAIPYIHFSPNALQQTALLKWSNPKDEGSLSLTRKDERRQRQKVFSCTQGTMKVGHFRLQFTAPSVCDVLLEEK